MECGGPKIGHKERKEEKCCYGEFLEGNAWNKKDVEEMEKKIRCLKGFNDAMMMLDKRGSQTVCDMKECDDSNHETAYDLKIHLENKHKCGKKVIRNRFRYSHMENTNSEEDERVFENSNDQILSNLLKL